MVPLVRSVVLLQLFLALGVSDVLAQEPDGPSGGLVVSTAPTIEPTRLPNTGPFSIPFTISNNGSSNIPGGDVTCILTGPVTCNNVTPTDFPFIPPGGSVGVTVTYSVGAVGSGSIGIRATPDIGNPAEKSRIVTVANGGNARPAFVNHNPENVDRGICLTVGAGEAAGVSCGDLFVTHTMPAFPTLGRDRAPTLYYNSAAATGFFLVAANLAEPTSVATPDKIRVFLTVGTSKDSAEYSPLGSYPYYQQPHQIVLGRNLAAQPTGVYPMTLLVRNVYTGYSSLDTTITSTALVVNRSNSEYGRGWSLLGVEQVFFDASDSTRLIWLAGDGSIRLYRKATPGSSVFQGAAGDGPDSLVRFDTLLVGDTLARKWYRRDLRHGAAVRFDETGHHVDTRNRTGQKTQFRWGMVAGQTRLTSIVLAPDSSKRYSLYWDLSTARLDHITDPYARELRATMALDTLTRLVLWSPFAVDSANHDTTTFQYQAGRMTRRVSETSALAAGFVGSTFEYQNNARLTKVKIPSGAIGTDTAVVALSPWDEKGLALAYAGQVGVLSIADTALPTRVDGPLSGTGDATDFWVNRFGQPIKSTQLGLNATTLIWHDSIATLPALATRVQYPNLRTVRMAWDARGNLDTLRDSSFNVDGQPTTVTKYAYGDANAPDSPRQITDALGRHTDYSYTTLGLTDSVIAPTGTRTKFFYRGSGSLTGVVDSVADRAVQTWWESTDTEHTQDQVNRFQYDGVGNVTRTISPVGVASEFTRDLAGRITDSYDPMGMRRHFAYDGFNRMLSVEQYTTQQTPPGGSAIATCDETQIQCSQSFNAFLPASQFMWSLVTSYQYNDDGLLKASDPRVVWRSFAYDARGNKVKEIDPYDTDVTTRARNWFNSAGLLDSTKTRMAGGLVRYRYDGMGRRTAMLLSRVIDAGDTTYADSISYAYDIMGNLLVAKNNQGTITRTYFANGALRTQVNTVSTKDSLTFKYDATGARTRLVRVRGTYTDSVAYFYGSTTGLLDSMLVWWGSVAGSRKISFTWDQLGRRRQIVYPTGVTVSFKRDANGLERRIASVNPANPTSSDRFDFEFRNDIVGPGSQIRHQDNICSGWTGSVYEDPLGMLCGSIFEIQRANQYNLFGMLVTQQSTRVGVSGSTTITDSMRYDRSGNMSHIWHSLAATPLSDATWYQYFNDVTSSGDSTNVLEDMKEMVTGVGIKHYAYTQDLSRYNETIGTVKSYWYDAAGRVSGISAPGYTSAPNTCTYDPDGQMMRACDSNAPNLTFEGNNVGTAGDWVFVHGPGLDDPLIGIDRACEPDAEVYWITDGNGRQLAFATKDGSFNSTTVGCYRSGGGQYSGGTQNSGSFSADRFGSDRLPGFSFFRNRVYDQATGRWTQEDPIGIAGGLNLYQYAGNNPAAYTDPFGLKVTVVGEQLNRLIQELLKSSPTFARIFNALDSRSADKINYVINQSSPFTVRQFSLGTNSVGFTFVPGVNGRTEVAGGETLGPDVIADELIHAAGYYAKEAGQDTGVPATCQTHASADAAYRATGDDTCRDVRQQINDERAKAKKNK